MEDHENQRPRFDVIGAVIGLSLLFWAVLITTIFISIARGQDIPGQTVLDTIVPTSTNDLYATHAAIYGKGGLRSVATIAERDAIPEPRREVGMVVWVESEGVAYRLASLSGNWVASGSGSVAIGTNLFALVPTTIEMLALTTNVLQDGMILTTLGRDAVGDGGGLNWQYDADDTSTVTNYGTVLAGGTGRFLALNWDGDVRAFGVYPGETNWVRIQNALDIAPDTSRRVYFPPGEYFVTGTLTNWSGVTVEGDGIESILRRRFWIPQGNPLTGSFDTTKKYFLLTATGTTVRKLKVDGGASLTTVSTFGDVDQHPTYAWMNTDGWVNQTQYGDIVPLGGPYTWTPAGGAIISTGADAASGPGSSTITISEVVLEDSAGSSIKNADYGAKGVLVVNCDILGYYDHAIYFTGWPQLGGTNLPVSDLIIENNRIRPASQARANGAIKLRNKVNRAVIHGNTIIVTNDVAISLDGGDSSGSDTLGPVVVSGNAIDARYAISSSTPTNQASRWHGQITGNSIKVRNTGQTGYWLGVSHGETGLSGHWLVSDNALEATDPDTPVYSIISGYAATGTEDVPTVVLYRDNTHDGWFLNQVYGRLEWHSSGNLWDGRRGTAATNAFVLFNIATPTPNYLPAAGSLHWSFNGDVIWNYAAAIFDSDTSVGASGNNLISGATVEFRGVKLLGHPSRGWLTDWRGTTIGSYAGSNALSAWGNVTRGIVSDFNTLPDNRRIEGLNSQPGQLDGYGYRGTNFVFGRNGAQMDLALNGGTGNVARLLFQTDGVNRQEIRRTTGNDLQFIRRDASGVNQTTPLWLDSENGFVGINDQTAPSYPLDVRGNAAVGDGTASQQTIKVRAASGYRRGLEVQTVGATRWIAGGGTVAEEDVEVTITVTNTPVVGETLTIDGATRWWGGGASATNILIGANPNESATNLFQHLTNYPISSVTVSMTGPDSVQLIGTPGRGLVTTALSAWGDVEEVRANTGTDFDFTAYDDSSTPLATVARITRIVDPGETAIAIFGDGSLRVVGFTNLTLGGHSGRFLYLK